MNWAKSRQFVLYGARQDERAKGEIAQMRKRLEREAEERWELAALVAEAQKRKAKR